jgi:hypothetical protein
MRIQKNNVASTLVSLLHNPWRIYIHRGSVASQPLTSNVYRHIYLRNFPITDFPLKHKAIAIRIHNSIQGKTSVMPYIFKI